MYLHPKNRLVLKALKKFCFHHFRVFSRCRFQNVPVRAPFSKSTVFKIWRQKICRFRVNGRPFRHIFHRFQNLPASCERSLKQNRCYCIKRSVFLLPLLDTALLQAVDKISFRMMSRFCRLAEFFIVQLTFSE